MHKLTEILRRLTADGNTVIVIEHNLDVIKTADYIIDIGPEGGDKGEQLLRGTPEEAEKVLAEIKPMRNHILFISSERFIKIFM